MKRLGRFASRWSCAAALTLPAVSCASRGESSSDTQPSSPPVASCTGRKRAAALALPGGGGGERGRGRDPPPAVEPAGALVHRAEEVGGLGEILQGKLEEQ